MAMIAREYNKEMGETGAGICDAASIDMSKNNTFTTKWAEVSAKCPWYFEMRDLIGQRPNLVPTGLGHSASAVTNGVLIPANPLSGDELEEEEEEDNNDGNTSSVRPNDTIHSPRSTPEPITGKRTFFEIDDIAKSDFDDDAAGHWTPIGSGDNYQTSSPVPSESGLPVLLPPSKPTKKTKLAEFSEIALREEKTRHKELDLAAYRVRQQIRTTEAKAWVLEKREDTLQEKQQERFQKLRLKELKMLGLFLSSHSSDYALSDYGNTFDGFNGNVAAGSSTLPDFSDFNTFALDSQKGNSIPSGEY
ncbi:hypothetical protein B0H14DRAFT_3635757 [Mycena olivaceomarginata]|nr:hypothetical protein B0H14DRAFT_3635757 [Mycena olivaceomarginata]